MPESLGVSWLPPYHDMGLVGGILQPLYVGSTMILMPPVSFLQRPLRWLEAKGCGFVPRLLEANPEQLRIITTNCGTRVQHLDDQRRRDLFAELEQYGVRHDDLRRSAGRRDARPHRRQW